MGFASVLMADQAGREKRKFKEDERKAKKIVCHNKRNYAFKDKWEIFL